MGHKHTKAEILAGALAAAFDDGLSQLTFGRIAKRLGISDRIVVYYFPTKDDLIGEVLFAMGTQLQETLAPTFSSPAADHLDLLRSAWPILARAEADPVFALFFEAGGLAATGLEPYRSLVPQLVEAWIDWAAEFVEGAPARRRSEAEAAIAVLDGLLLLRQLAGPDIADRAASTIGVRVRSSAGSVFSVAGDKCSVGEQGRDGKIGRLDE
jgi:AcrR family transcriptional regulator